LYLNDNQITDISVFNASTFIHDLHNYSCLDLRNNQISDISPLSSVRYVSSLYLDGNLISDITPLNRLLRLDSISLDNNLISDISVLSRFNARLAAASLMNNNISDVSPLFEMNRLEFLNLRDNPLSMEQIVELKSKVGALVRFGLPLSECSKCKLTENYCICTIDVVKNGKFIAPIEPIADKTGWTAVSDRAGLEAIADNLSGKFYLTNDIDLAGEDWNVSIGGNILTGYTNTGHPIIVENKDFSGIFDGQGYVIRNMTMTDINLSGGLFGSVRNAVIRNVGLEGTNIKVSNTAYYGGLGGISGDAENTTISNCFNSGVVVSSYEIASQHNYAWKSSGNVGGLVGVANNVTIENSYNLGEVTAITGYETRVGGLVGDTFGNNLTTIDNSFNRAVVTGFSSDSTDAQVEVGGITAGGGKINNSFNTGNVYGSVGGAITSYVAGIAGGGDISNCYNTGLIFSDRYASGIGGTNIRSSYNTGYVYGDRSAGGIVDYANGNITECYNLGDVFSRGRAGGIAAEYSSRGSLNRISRCFNSGNVSAISLWGNTYAGGIAGIFSTSVSGWSSTTNPVEVTGAILNSYNTGKITASSQGTRANFSWADSYAYAGGIVGSATVTASRHNNGASASAISIIRNCYNIGKVGAFSKDYESYSDGIVGHSRITPPAAGISAVLRIEYCYGDADENTVFTGFDFSHAWTVIEGVNGGLPVLRVFNAVTTRTLPNFIAPIEVIADKSGWTAVSDRAELEAINDNLRGKYYLTADIDLNGKEWVPIGDATSSPNGFMGTFDGQGHVIRNMTITEKSAYAGLFGTLSGAEIRNVGLEDTNIDITFDSDIEFFYAGGIAATMYSSRIRNVFNSGKISVTMNTAGNVTVGGIAGIANPVTFDNVYNTADVSVNVKTYAHVTVGGIGGFARRSEMSNCFNTGDISSIGGNNSVSVWNNSVSGGLLGEATRGIALTNSFNSGSVFASATRVAVSGGLIGDCDLDHDERNVIIDSYNSGVLTADTARTTHLFGLFGATSGLSPTVYDSYSVCDDEHDFTRFDFDNTWTFIDGVNGGLPVLRVFERMYTPIQDFPTPDGYSDNDYQKLVKFMSQENNFGVSVDSRIWQRAIQWNDDTPKRVTCISFEDDWSGHVYGKLDVSDFTALESIVFAGMEIDGIDLTNTPSLEHLHISGNLVEIDVTGNPALKTLRLHDNTLVSLDLSNNSLLEEVICHGNKLTGISSFEDLPNLKYVSVNHNFLDLNCPAIQESIAKIQATVDRNGGEFIYTPQRTPDIPPVTTTPPVTTEPPQTTTEPPTTTTQPTTTTSSPTTTTPPTTTTTSTAMPPFTPAIADGNPTIGDALEILKYLAKLPNTINNGALSPTIDDALEVLRYLAKLPSVFGNKIKPVSLEQ
jgi:hypothetical protein